MINFKEVDYKSGYSDFELFEDQKDFVATIEVLLARAYLYRNERSKVYQIFNDETPVGMVLYYDSDEYNCYNLAELFIDKHYQNKGYATEALKLLFDEMKKDGKYKKVYLFYIKEDKAAEHLYSKFGFKEVVKNDEAIGMEMEL